MNKWINEQGIVISETRPTPYSYPVVNERRINKRECAYTPYVTGSAEWRKAANEALASMARAEFERR